MSEMYIGQILAFGGNFAIKGYAFCSAQLLPIPQYTALFSILGTTYGGDGRTTFGLPDLRGRAPLSSGQGPGLPNYALGQMGGITNVTLTVGNLPRIDNLIPCSSKSGTVSNPTGNFPAETNNPTDLAIYNTYSPKSEADGYMGVSLPGSNQPFETLSPYLAINWLIVMEGLFPPRN